MDKQSIETLRSIQLASRRLSGWFLEHEIESHAGPEELVSLDFKLSNGDREVLRSHLETMAVAIEAWGRLSTSLEV